MKADFKSTRDAFMKVEVGQTATINGKVVRRLTAQKWEVDGVAVVGRHDAQQKAMAGCEE